MYVKRHAEKNVHEMLRMFGAVLVAGPRQAGKTTMLEKITSGVGYVTLDDPIVRARAEEESGTFLRIIRRTYSWMKFKRRLPFLNRLSCILTANGKRAVFMCDSQQFKMMKGISESLAGRIGLVTMLGFSLREEYGIECYAPLIPTEEYFAERKGLLADISYDEVWNRIHRH